MSSQEPDPGTVGPAGEPLHLLGGIDEAGLGPILGPMVVAGLVLEGPAGQSPWETLATWFCKKPRDRRDRRIRVDDSKRVKTGAKGLAQLERTVLCLHYAVHGRLPESLGEFLEGGLRGLGAELSRYPWYEDLSQAMPRWNDRRSLELEAHLARQGMEEKGLRCLSYPFHCVPVGRFNEAIQRLDNKSLALFEASLPPLVELVQCSGRQAEEEGRDFRLRVVMDRQGGRGRYQVLLSRAFPGTALRTTREVPGLSEYELGTHTTVLFVEKGEDRSFPTAAASCLAKYVRELLIERLNEWFLERKPGLAPTAGYYSDGRRFLDELGESLGDLPRELLVRMR